MSFAEAALEAWASLPNGPFRASASLPDLRGVQEETLQALSRTTPGDDFVSFWRSLGEASEGEVTTLPIGPLGLAREAAEQIEPAGVMQELEAVRDIMLDHFEASGGQPLPLATMHAAVQAIRCNSSIPEFWNFTLPKEGVLSLPDLTLLLLVWLRDAAALELPVEGVDGDATFGPAKEGPRSIREGHHMRSAMLTLRADLGEAGGGWMRSAVLPAVTAPHSGDKPTASSLQETLPLVCRQRGMREACWQVGDDASPHHGGDCNMGGLKPTLPILRPTSPLPSVEVRTSEVEPMPVLLHIYDVTQEPGIQRLNKVLANKHLPLKFGGIFHAGVEVDGNEWSYGCTELEEDLGVLPNPPKMHPDHHYRQTVPMLPTVLSVVEVHEVLAELMLEYTGPTYDLLRKNCCHFANALCLRLGSGSIPCWVHRLARLAAHIENILQAVSAS